jgi:Family of unknown function (DUF6459)
MTITYPLNTEMHFTEGAITVNTVVNEFIHPMLELSQNEILPLPALSRKLYLVPTADPAIADSSIDPIFGPQPSALTELPDVVAWSKSFVIGLIEIWAGKRPAMQIARSCHRNVHNKLQSYGKSLAADLPKIRKIYIAQPIEGVIESTVTLRIKDRVRSLILRFEGVDKRWICTELFLL